jgi:hypothetical protein
MVHTILRGSLFQSGGHPFSKLWLTDHHELCWRQSPHEGVIFWFISDIISGHLRETEVICVIPGAILNDVQSTEQQAFIRKEGVLINAETPIKPRASSINYIFTTGVLPAFLSANSSACLSFSSID